MKNVGVLASSNLGFLDLVKEPVSGAYFILRDGYLYSDEAGTVLQSTDQGTVQHVKPAKGSGNAAIRPATPADAPIYNAGNDSVRFDGIAQYLTTEFLIDEFLISFGVRFRSNAAASGFDVPIGSSFSSSRSFISLEDGVAGAGMGSVGSTTFRDPAATDLRSATQFHTAFVTYDRDNATKLYVDGVLVNTIASAGSTFDNEFALGGRIVTVDGGADLFFAGDLTHAYMTKEVLTDAEVLTIHNEMSA